MEEKQKKAIVKKETKKVVKTTSISSEEMKDKTLQELKKVADKSFKEKYTNKKKMIGVTLGALGLAAIGTVTPIVVLNANKEISISVQSVNATADKYKVKVKKGTKIKDIKIVELEGYEFVGFFKDEACTKPYKLTDELKKATTIYASYKSKAAIVEYTVIVNGQEIKVSSFADVTIGDVIKNIETLPYETDGRVYFDEACTIEADLNETKTENTTLYTKTATVDDLLFVWKSSTSSWSVAGAGGVSEIVIPTRHTDGNHDGIVNEIGGSAFYGCSGLTSITMPNSVTTIGDYAFYFCSLLTKVTIPDSVISIGSNAFYNCDQLTSISIPHGVTIIKKNTFAYCRSLNSITIPNSVTTIEDTAFVCCDNLFSITIPSSVTSIGDYVGYMSGLTNIIIDSKTIANSLTNATATGCIINYVTTIYIKTGLDTSNSTYLTTNFTKQATSDKAGYHMWVKKS